MATSRLVGSLHNFQDRFHVFENHRTSVRHIYNETQDAWLKWRKIGASLPRRNSQNEPPTANDSIPDKDNQRSSNDSSEDSVLFETQMANVIKLLSEKPTLVFVGQLKSGKSTLANLILQQRVLPSDEGPCTARMVKLKFSEEASGGAGKAYLQLLRADGTVIGERKELETMEDSQGTHRLLIPRDIVSLGRETGFGERHREFWKDGKAAENVAWVEIYCSHPLLKYIQVVDSPGKGENKQLDELVNDTVSHGLVQTLVYVIDGCRGLTTKDKSDLRWIKNQLREDGRGKAKILFVCTRIDEALREDDDEPPPMLPPEELPEDSDDDQDHLGTKQDTCNDEYTHSDITSSDKEQCNLLEYSTRIHERVFDSLVTEEFLATEQGMSSHDQCPLFHAVSAYAARELAQEEDENPFVRDIIRFEECLAETIVENLNVHLKSALEELITEQVMLLETVFQFKFSHARTGIEAQRKIDFITTIEKRVYQKLKTMTGETCSSQLEDLIKELKATCLKTLPQQAASETFLVDENETNFKKRDKKVAKQVRDFVCDKLNEKFCKRVRDQMKVLNVAETVERCVKSMQDQVQGDLQVVRAVTILAKAAYTPVLKPDIVKEGLPLKLIFKDFFKSFFASKELESKYTNEWKKTVAESFLKSLDPKKLARVYCTEVQDTVEKAHAKFSISFADLEAAAQEIGKEARGQQSQIRLSDGYELVNVFLKSKSFLGSFQHGMPGKGEVIGVGPTTTVYKCQGGSWGDVVLKARKPWPPVSGGVWPASLYFASECLDHKNVQKAIGFLFPSKDPVDEIWVLEESCLCSLEDVFKGTPSLSLQLSGLSWLNIARDAVDGLLHLFCQGIPHHNIKPSNVLLSQRLEARLSDMGMYDIASMKDSKITRAVYFVAPELISESEGVVATDVYSIGILLWYLFKAYSTETKPPTAVPDPKDYTVRTNGSTASAFLAKVGNPEIQLRPNLEKWSSPNHRLRDAADLMKNCWHHDSSKRPDCGRLKGELQMLTKELKK